MKRISKRFCSHDGGGSVGGMFGKISLRTKVWAFLPSGSSSNVFGLSSLTPLRFMKEVDRVGRTADPSDTHTRTHAHIVPPPHPLAQGTAAFPANPLPGAGSPQSLAHESCYLTSSLSQLVKVSMQKLLLHVTILHFSSSRILAHLFFWSLFFET